MNKWWQEEGMYLTIFASALVVSLAIFSKNSLSLDTLQKVTSIFGTLSIIIALATYFNKKRQDNTIAAIDQVSFFRKDVIDGNERFLQELIKKTNNQNYVPPRIRLDTPSLEVVRKNFSVELKAQEQFFGDRNIELLEMSVLNMLEELSLKIAHFKTYDHPSLSSIRNPFIELVELHAAMLLHQREIVTGLPTYSTILKIYSSWKDIADRRTPLERIKNKSNEIHL